MTLATRHHQEMMRSAVALVLVFALTSCSSVSDDPGVMTNDVKFPDPATTALDPAKAAQLQAVLTKVIGNPDIESGSRGITAAVVSDKWVWSGAAGKDAAGTTLTPRTSMGVASITKTFVAAEVMLLVKDKKVDLNAPLSGYVKHKLTENHATVWQHLSMRSGVPNYLSDDYARMDKAIKAAPGKHFTPEEALSYYTAQPVQPDVYSYSNINYILLGMLIEKKTGEKLATVLRRDLADPAGLEHAAFQDGEKPTPPLAEDRNPVCGKAVDGFTPCRAIASLSVASAGMAADAPTIARWGYQLYGGRVVPNEQVQQMIGGDGGYGLGTMLFSQTFGSGTAYGHRGEMPDHTSLFIVIPEHKVAVSIILADGNKRVDAVMTDFVTALQPSRLAPTPSPVG